MPPALLAVTVAAMVIVTAVCAVVSYCHIRDLACLAGIGSLAGWLPLGVDGLDVAASCSLIVDRRLGRPGHALAWTGAALGLAGRLAANVLAVDPDLVSLRAIEHAAANAVGSGGQYAHQLLAILSNNLSLIGGKLTDPIAINALEHFARAKGSTRLHIESRRLMKLDADATAARSELRRRNCFSACRRPIRPTRLRRQSAF